VPKLEPVEKRNILSCLTSFRTHDGPVPGAERPRAETESPEKEPGDIEKPTSASIVDADTDDKPREKCGVFGVFAPGEDVSRITFFGLFALQHRGQESAGIAAATSEYLVCHKDMGLVSQVFKENLLAMLKGRAAIGHVRYSTTGASKLVNAQPYAFTHHRGRNLAIAHNGNIVNAIELRDELSAKGIRPETTTDTEILGLLLEDYYTRMPIIDALQQILPRAKGAYSLVILTNEEMIAARDPFGIRPLALGSLGDNFVIASESCAFPLVGATFMREVQPGEIIVVNSGGLKSYELPGPKSQKLCMFEMFYFARPDSILLGKLVYEVRTEMGRQLAREAPVDADVVISVPDSGITAAIGYSMESKIPYGEGLIKNRYVGRTFIEPLQSFRDLGVKIKLNPLTEVLEGKRVVLVDDSIVRGSTSTAIVRLIRSAGAKEIHMRLSSPPIRFPCFYGIDFGTPDELIAANHSVEEIRDIVGADSLHYLSIDGMVKATGLQKEQFCLACFNDEYPIPVPSQLRLGKLMFEREE